MLEARGIAAGCHDHAGVRLAGEWLHEGPCGLPEAGQMLVGNRGCAAMVLSLPAADTLAAGLPVARYDVLVLGPETVPDAAAAMLRAGTPGQVIMGADPAAIVAALLPD